MIVIRPSTKDFFFDRELVRKHMDAKTASALARGGGLIRRIAQNSMRSRKRASPAGSPPSRHVPRGQGISRIYYVFDPVTKSVVIGPVLYTSQLNDDGTTVPQVNEFGGHVKVSLKRTRVAKDHTFRVGERGPIRELSQTSSRSKRFLRPVLKTQRQVDRAQRLHNEYVAMRRRLAAQGAKYPPRPFMGPALEKATPKLPDLWQSAVQQAGGAAGGRQ
jgi:hypothetical protein